MEESTISIIATIVGTALLFLIKQFFKEKSETKEEIFRVGVRVGYNIVNEISKTTDTTIDDKAALGLKYLSEFLDKKGIQLSPVRAEEAKLLFKAMHGEEKTAQAVVVPVVAENPQIAPGAK